MTAQELQNIKKIAEGTDERIKSNVWENYGKQNVYCSVGRTDKKITIHCGNMAVYYNRPGAATEAKIIAEALQSNGFNFTFTV